MQIYRVSVLYYENAHKGRIMVVSSSPNPYIRGSRTLFRCILDSSRLTFCNLLSHFPSLSARGHTRLSIQT